MKVIVTGGPAGLRGEPFLDAEKKPLDFKRVITDALLTNFPDEMDLGGKDKLDRWRIARRVHDAEQIVDLTAEEITMVKKLVAKSFVTAVSAQTWELLEGTATATPLRAVE